MFMKKQQQQQKRQSMGLLPGRPPGLHRVIIETFLQQITAAARKVRNASVRIIAVSKSP